METAGGSHRETDSLSQQVVRGAGPARREAGKIGGISRGSIPSGGVGLMAYACSKVETNRCTGQTHCRCFACGEPVCKACSRKQDWYRWKDRRICFSCVREHEHEKGVNP